ncbi:MAG TPA: molybdate ABC transporter substrate-binding protein [Candidatus Limnocylindrales bacterium]|nr:molybdate ABC transporter substrate-binding protein [Candidatus Limnocylindrales bacterium]
MKPAFRRNTVPLFLALLALVSLPFAQAANQPPAEQRSITISAAVSLKDALDAIQTAFHATDPTVALHFNFGASGTLQRQIEQGAPVDIFISASPSEMDSLASKTLIRPNTRRDLLKNAVVLIAPKSTAGNTTGISSFQDLLRPEIKIVAIGDPRVVPAGAYAREVLVLFGLYDRLKPKFVFAKDVRQVLTYVATGNADAGIVYATDARTSAQVSVVATAPEDSHAPVIYPVAVLAGSKNSAAADNFLNFLFGPQASAIFQKFGFIPVAR